MKKDLFTGEEFKPKRNNQKFVTAANRIKYHNEKNRQQREAKSFIDKPLSLNHKILNSLLKPGERKAISRYVLLGKGFDFKIISHSETYKGKRSPALYDFIIPDLFQEGDTVSVYRKKSYENQSKLNPKQGNLLKGFLLRLRALLSINKVTAGQGAFPFDK